MTTAATRRPAPAKRPAAAKPEVEKPAELTAGERLAADLSVLADTVAATPAAADVAYEDVLIVLRVMSSGGQDALAAVLAERAATEQPARDPADPLFSRHCSERQWLLPNRAIRLSTTSWVEDVDDIEAAGR